MLGSVIPSSSSGTPLISSPVALAFGWPFASTSGGTTPKYTFAPVLGTTCCAPLLALSVGYGAGASPKSRLGLTVMDPVVCALKPVPDASNAAWTSKRKVALGLYKPAVGVN